MGRLELVESVGLMGVFGSWNVEKLLLCLFDCWGAG